MLLFYAEIGPPLIALLLPNGLSNRRNVINYLDLMHNYIRDHAIVAFPVNPDRGIMLSHTYLCKGIHRGTAYILNLIRKS